MEKLKTSGRKESLAAVDVAKFIMSFFVVAIHTQSNLFPADTPNIFFSNFLIRLAVPFYFVASGYFFFNSLTFKGGRIAGTNENRRKFFSFLKRTLVLFLLWAAIYLIWEIITAILNKTSVLTAVKGYLLYLPRHGFGMQFWYLIFLIYAVVILYILMRIIDWRILAVPVAILYIGFVLYYGYSNANIIPDGLRGAFYIAPLDFEIYVLYRALGLTFAGLVVSKIRKNIGFAVSLVITLMLCVLMFLEIYFYHGKEMLGPSSYVFFTLPAAAFLFLTISKIKAKGGKVTNTLRCYSTFIYCFHVLPIFIFQRFWDKDFIERTYGLPLIAAISFVFAVVFVALSRKKHFGFLKNFY